MAKTTRAVVFAAAAAAAALWWSIDSTGGPGTRLTDTPNLRTPRPELPSSGRAPFDLRHAERAVIAGQVRDSEGHPIVGATVCAGSGWHELSEREREARVCVRSENDGHYRIEGLMPVPHFVQASAPQFVPGKYRGGPSTRARGRVILRGGQETRDIDLTLRAGGVELKGIVRDHSGGELEGAQVGVEDAYTRSGPDGSFSLWVAPGQVVLLARAEGYASGQVRGIAPGQAFEIALTPEAVLIGRVVRASDGRPLEGASVRVQKSTSWEKAGPALTDSNGNFRLDGLKPGAYKAEAFHDEAYGMAAESAVLGLGETSSLIEIVAHPAYSVEGTVLLTNGETCDGGQVRLVDKTRTPRSGAIEVDGIVRVQGVVSGIYEVQVDCSYTVPMPRYEPVVVAEQTIRGLRWEVQKGQAIHGQVVTATGQGVSDVWVHANALADSAALLAQTTSGRTSRTEASGTFEVVGLLPGRYSLIASSDEYPQPERPVEVDLRQGQDLQGVRIELPATGELRGTVKDDLGNPAKRTEVSLRGNGGSVRSSTRTADDGSFRLAHVPAGDYRVVATVGPQTLGVPGTPEDGTPVLIAIGEVREIQLVVESQIGRVSGRVVDSGGGPLDDAFVEAVPESGMPPGGSPLQQSRWWSSFGLTRSQKLTDQDGRFELTDLGDGPYTIVAQRRGGGEGSIEHVVVGSSEIEVRIADAGSLAGNVRFRGGGAPQQFSVGLFVPNTGFRANDKFFRTDGMFHFPEVPGGDYIVTIDAPEGSDTAKVTVADGEHAEMGIELAPHVTVRGRVLDSETGGPVAGMRVAMVTAGQGQSMQSGPAPSGVTDLEGRFELKGVPVGSLQTTIQSNNADSTYAWTAVLTQIPMSGSPLVELPPLKIAKLRLADSEEPGELGFTLKRSEPQVKEASFIVEFVQPSLLPTGLQSGDEIVSVDGQDATGTNAYLYHTLTRVSAGTKIRFGLRRGPSIELIAATRKPN